MANGSSWITLDGLRDDLKSWFTTNASTYNVDSINRTLECVAYTPTQLDSKLERKQNSVFHIGLYETSPDELLVAGGGKVLDFDQAYEISLFYGISKKSEYDENAERILMNTKDAVFAWGNGIVSDNSISTITSNNLLRWQFFSSGEPIREDKYCYITMQFIGFKNTN